MEHEVGGGLGVVVRRSTVDGGGVGQVSGVVAKGEVKEDASALEGYEGRVGGGVLR